MSPHNLPRLHSLSLCLSYHRLAGTLSRVLLEEMKISKREEKVKVGKLGHRAQARSWILSARNCPPTNVKTVPQETAHHKLDPFRKKLPTNKCKETAHQRPPAVRSYLPRLFAVTCHRLITVTETGLFVGTGNKLFAVTGHRRCAVSESGPFAVTGAGCSQLLATGCSQLLKPGRSRLLEPAVRNYWP